MKLNQTIIFLLLIGILTAELVKSSTSTFQSSDPKKKALRNIAKIIAANVIQKLEANVNLEGLLHSKYLILKTDSIFKHQIRFYFCLNLLCLEFREYSNKKYEFI